jgi:MoaA/NifB/PqqE/SkfB family radical SAM enzyme
MKATGTSFNLGGEADSTNISKDELRDALLRIIGMKKMGYSVINTMEYLLDAARYLDGKSSHPCMGGKRFVYVDWNLDAYPCMSKGKPVNLWKYDFAKAPGKCNDCMLQCFREPSVLFSQSIRTVIKELPFMALMGANRIKTLLK